MKPTRRLRYSGTHPKKFHEKYKELDPQKYPEDVNKIISSGKTPAGMHRCVMLNEVIETLCLKPGQVGLDCTLGYGGHAQELLQRIIPKGRLYAMDVDPVEIKRTTERLRDLGYNDKVFIPVHSNFAGAIKLLNLVQRGFDFILADLGVSSMQLDDPKRGFTFKADAPLDLRLNQASGQTAAELIRKLHEKRLYSILKENSDEPYAQPIARAIFHARNNINTTTELAQIVAYALGAKSIKDASNTVKDSIRRTFQALRIELNEEFSALGQLLRDLPMLLKKGGKAVIITFHSGEDLRVINNFEKGFISGIYNDFSRKRIRPSANEQYDNSRCRSALLRWVIKK